MPEHIKTGDLQAGELTFKQASDELEGILRQLESNQLELEASLKSYERGVSLLRVLQTRLDDAQQKITVLLGELDLDGIDRVEDNNE